MKQALQDALGDARGLWFLCSGNVVRSAFAEIYARHKGCPIPVHSAATRYHNDAIFPETVKELTARGIGRVAIERFEPLHLDDVARTLKPDEVVFGMKQEHVDDFRRHVDTPRALDGRLFLLGDAFWVSEEIADPVLEGADYSKTFARVAQAVELVVGYLKIHRAGALR